VARRFIAELVARGTSLAARPLFGSAGEPIPLAVAAGPFEAGDTFLVEERAGSGRVLGGRLARAGSARAGLYRIAVAHGLDPLHPPVVLSEARRFRSHLGTDEPTLLDLTGLPFVTIDNPASRDLDQAVQVERATRGNGFLVRYALADASYYVRPGTALFAEALARGASYYLPGLSIPMLPRLLCEGLVSLSPGQVRRALVFEMRLSSDGSCLETRVLRGRVRSARKLSYPGVQRYYDDPGGSGWGGQPWRETLDLLREVGHLRLEEARRRHVVQYRRAEVEVRLQGGDRAACVIVSDRRLDVERFNEQISLLTNGEGGRLLAAARGLEHVQAIFRVHPEPNDAALAGLERLVDGLVERHGLSGEVWRWRRQFEPLAAYLERLPRSGRSGRLSRAIERQALLLGNPARFALEPEPHFGVGATAYARFSSPMREIVGVFTHKEAVEMLRGPEGAATAAGDRELRSLVVEAGNRAREIQNRVEREANGLAIDLFLGADLALPSERRPRRRATILGLEPHRVHCQLDNPTVDLKVDVADLAQRWGCEWSLDPAGAALVPTGADAPVLCLGDAVTLAVTARDPGRRRWHFELGVCRT
jgi:ribonuclease R